MKVTLDTNVVTDIIRERCAYSMEIYEHYKRGKIALAVTTRISYDAREETLKSEVRDLFKVERLTAGYTVGLGAIGEDCISSQEDSALAAELLSLIFPGYKPRDTDKHRSRVADVDHLIAHKNSDSDVFLTGERSMRNQAPVLLKKYGITLMSPGRFVRSELRMQIPNPPTGKVE